MCVGFNILPVRINLCVWLGLWWCGGRAVVPKSVAILSPVLSPLPATAPQASNMVPSSFLLLLLSCCLSHPSRSAYIHTRYAAALQGVMTLHRWQRLCVAIMIYILLQLSTGTKSNNVTAYCRLEEECSDRKGKIRKEFTLNWSSIGDWSVETQFFTGQLICFDQLMTSV